MKNCYTGNTWRHSPQITRVPYYEAENRLLLQFLKLLNNNRK